MKSLGWARKYGGTHVRGAVTLHTTNDTDVRIYFAQHNHPTMSFSLLRLGRGRYAFVDTRKGEPYKPCYVKRRLRAIYPKRFTSPISAKFCSTAHDWQLGGVV